MSKVIILTILLFSCFVFLKSECDLSLFRKKNIVPSVIPDVPKQPLTVELSQKNVFCGELLSTVSSVSLGHPKITYEADKDTYYTLIMLDPDVPSPDAPLLGPFLHWFVINIPGDDIDKGDEQKHYIAPSPPPPDPHRYIFTVFKQDKKLDNNECLVPREKFDLMDMMEKLCLFEISFGHYFNVTSEPDALIRDAVKETKI